MGLPNNLYSERERLVLSRFAVDILIIQIADIEDRVAPSQLFLPRCAMLCLLTFSLTMHALPSSTSLSYHLLPTDK